jgi:hypothetical protein
VFRGEHNGGSMTDQEQYDKNIFYNVKYLIRDVFKLKQLYALRKFINDCIEEMEEEA